MDREHPLILVVEDDDVIRETLVDLLSDEGYAVESATDGARALDLLAARRALGVADPSLILLDLVMPEMGGAEFARALASTPAPRPPLFVVSALHDAEARACSVGAVGMLAKPFRLVDLLDAIECLKHGD
jgi:CheY-like chemotaxis protein